MSEDFNLAGSMKERSNDIRSTAGASTGGTDDSASRRKATAPLTDEDADLGKALRDIYQKTVDESVPDEMLDLLKRLG